MPSPEYTPDLLGAIDRTLAQASASGALQALETRSEAIGGALPYVVHWASTLRHRQADRNAQRRAPPPGETPRNPFLPYESELYVADLGDTHVMLLNKFPVVPRHTLIVTREFAEQTASLDDADFCALASGMVQLDGLAFYNGGATAGASQKHKHLQLVPDASIPLARLFASARRQAGVGTLDAFDFLHAFVALDRAAFGRVESACAQLRQAYAAACASCSLFPVQGQMPPYNLLATPDWLLVVPRAAEFWRHGDIRISLNALSFTGSIFVARQEWIGAVKRAGLAALLDAVTFASTPSA